MNGYHFGCWKGSFWKSFYVKRKLYKNKNNFVTWTLFSPSVVYNVNTDGCIL